MRLSSHAVAGVLMLVAVMPAGASNVWPVFDSGYTDAVQWDHYSYIVKGERVFLFGGEMHPFRIPVPELWEDIAQKIKAMGMNAMSFYSMWGYHEPVPGRLDFEHGAHNLTRLMDAVTDAGLFVTPRPGPYINAELSAGGFPLWLTSGAYGKLRDNDTRYTDAWAGYQTAIAKIVAPYQIHKNGTVISYQIENELSQQWLVETLKVPNEQSIAYMEALEKNAHDNGIEVALTHNNQKFYKSWSKDYDTVGAGGDVDIYGLDSYPVCWSCNPQDCSSAVDNFVLLNYYDTFQSTAPNNPSLLPEFQGGKVYPLGGASSACLDSVGREFRNLYYRHNIDQKVSAMMLYMVYGGTSWGWTGVPFLATSYDYSTPIAEDRRLRESFYEIKNLALFTRVASSLTKVDRIANNTNYTTNTRVHTTELRNPDDYAGFYVVRHNDSTREDRESYKLRIQTTVGNLTVPQFAHGNILEGHVAKILVTDFCFGRESLLYSTAEILTYAIFDGKPTLAFWGQPGETGEFLIKGASSVRVINGVTQVAEHHTEHGVVVTYTQGSGRTVLEVGHVRVLLLDRSTADLVFVTPLSNDPHVRPDNTVIVHGPSLVRTAKISGDVLTLTGDLVNDTALDVFAPKAVKSVFWNGVQVATHRTTYGSLSGSLQGPQSVILPPLTGWKSIDSLPEAFPGYDDSGVAWSVANRTYTPNTDYANATKPYLFADMYGAHSGYVLWRGYFDGNATGVHLTIQGGEGFGASAYLNGKFIGAVLGHANKTADKANLDLQFEHSLLSSNGSNVLLVLHDNSGHDEGSQALNPRGILNGTLFGSHFTTWKVAGTAGGNTNTTLDTIRGNYNEGGLAAERLGWHLNGFDDSKWESSAPEAGFTGATVRFYRTTAALNIPDGHDASVIMKMSNLDQSRNKIRALIFVNGYQYGRYMPFVGNASEFPVHPGLLNYGGDNTIALAVWAQDEAGAKVKLDWEVTESRKSSLNVKFDASYLQPKWTAARLRYA